MNTTLRAERLKSLAKIKEQMQPEKNDSFNKYLTDITIQHLIIFNQKVYFFLLETLHFCVHVFE